MSTTNVTVKNGGRMMVRASKIESGIKVTFADDCEAVIPFAVIPEIGHYFRLSSIELSTPYEVILYNLEGDSIALPWDFVRHYCDPSYQRKTEEIAIRGKQIFGERVRQLRESARMTQEKLAEAARIGRVTLVRIENGDQSPRYETILSLAKALGVAPERLLVDR